MANWKTGGWWICSYDKTQTWTELHTVYERLVEKKAVTIEITEGEGVSPEKTAKITEALFQLFLTIRNNASYHTAAGACNY